MRLPFGTTPDGEAVERVTLRNGAGIEVSVISYGAAIQELWAPDRVGRRANLVLGFADREDGRSIIPVAWVEERRSGRTLEIQTTEPGLQLYSGNSLDSSLAGTAGRAYPRRAGLALETQHFADSPHHESFPTTILRPGRIFRSTTVYRLALDK